MNTRVLITGADGQLGYELSKVLPQYFVTLPTSKSVQSSNIQLLDITNFNEVEKTVNNFNPDVIINCAAYTHVDNCEIYKNTAHEVNVGGVWNFIKASNKDVRIIQISSDYVFDGTKGPYKEKDLPNPISYYGKTKLESENILRGSQHRYLIIRPNVVYSSDIDKFNNFFSWVFKSLNAEKQINVVTDQISNPTLTKYLTDAIVKCILLQREGIYHFGSEDNLSRYEFAQLIAKVFNLNSNLIKPIKTELLKQTAKRPKHSGLCTNLIEDELEISILSTEYMLKEIKNNMVLA